MIFATPSGAATRHPLFANSVAKLDHSIASNGTLFNMKFHPAALEGRSGLESFAALVRGYFDRKGSHILVLTSPEMLMAPFFDYATLNNAEYIFGAVNKLNGKEQSIVIAPKSLAGDMLEATDAQTGVMSTIATIIIPLAIAVAGVVVYIRRRHK